MDDAMRLVTAAAYITGVAAVVLALTALAAALVLLRAAVHRLRDGDELARLRAEVDEYRSAAETTQEIPLPTRDPDTLTLEAVR